MANKFRIQYLQNQIKKIDHRIKAGEWRFGDHRMLNEYKLELDTLVNCKRK